MGRVVNLTPHRIVIRPTGGPEVTLAPDGRVARVAEQVLGKGTVAGIEVVDIRLTQSFDLPDRQPGVWLLVSLVLAVAASADRDDLLTPDTSLESAIRDATGAIVAVRRLRRVVA